MGLKEALTTFFNDKKPIKVGSPLAPMGEFPLISANHVVVDDQDTRLADIVENIGSGGGGGSVSVTYDEKTENLTIK